MVFAVDDPLPFHLRVAIGAALHSLSTAAKLAAPPAEESYDSAWAPIGKKARPRLVAAMEQLRALNDEPNCGARVERLRQFFEGIDRALSTLEGASPETIGDAAEELKRELSDTMNWLKLPIAEAITSGGAHGSTRVVTP